MKDSNPQKLLQRQLCYHYTNRQSVRGTRFILTSFFHVSRAFDLTCKIFLPWFGKMGRPSISARPFPAFYRSVFQSVRSSCSPPQLETTAARKRTSCTRWRTPKICVTLCLFPLPPPKKTQITQPYASSGRFPGSDRGFCRFPFLFVRRTVISSAASAHILSRILKQPKILICKHR